MLNECKNENFIHTIFVISKKNYPRCPTLSAVYVFTAVRCLILLRDEWKQKQVLTDCIILCIFVFKAYYILSLFRTMSLSRTERMGSCAQSEGLALARSMARAFAPGERLQLWAQLQAGGVCNGRNLWSIFSHHSMTLHQKFFFVLPQHQSCLSNTWFLVAWKHAVISPILNRKNSFLTQFLIPFITPFSLFSFIMNLLESAIYICCLQIFPFHSFVDTC